MILATVRSTIIDVGTITSIVAELSSSEEDLAQESVQVMLTVLLWSTAHIDTVLDLMVFRS